MHPQLAAIAGAQNGVFTTAQALTFGYSQREISRLARAGTWVRIRRGAYADGAIARGLGELGTHRLAIDATLLTVSSAVHVSHISAAVLHEVDLYDPDLSYVHLTRANRRSFRNEAGVQFHAGLVESRELTTVGARPVTTLARTVVDVARGTDFEHAVVAIDSALRIGARLDHIVEVMELSRNWPGAREAGRAVAFADPLAGSVGESRCRVLLALQRLPAPETQVPIHDDRGLVGIVDFHFKAEGTVLEFDGKTKYRVQPGGTPDEATETLWREKRREDRLRALGLEIVRVTWADLYRPAEVAERVRRAFSIARARRPLAG